MAIELITGQPGHGKTALAIVKGREFSDAGREVYAHGIKNLNYDDPRLNWKPIEDPTKWEDLPDGSVVIIDECYSTFPNRNPGAKVPPHVDAMARHRHRGFDFILITQQSIQIDPFLRGLIEVHQHVRQTSIFKSKTRIKRWDQWQSNTKAVSADTRDWVRPDWVFEVYTSTTLVTTKRSLPMWMRYALLAIVFVIGMVSYLKYRVNERITQGKEAATTAGALSAVGRRGASETEKRIFEPMTEQEMQRYKSGYAQAHLAVFPTMPWTAPIFDQRTPTADPILVCGSSLPGEDANGEWKDYSCTCLTEQGTVYEISEPECRTIARKGPVYNPYKQQQSTTPGAMPPPIQQAQQAPSAGLPIVIDGEQGPAKAEQFRPGV